MYDSKQSLRQKIRSRRQALRPAQQRQASHVICKRLARNYLFLNSQHIAFYLANDREIDPAPLLTLAHKSGKNCYLPKIGRDSSLGFVRYRPGDPLLKNRYGIPEPCTQREIINPGKLDMILLPLVAFDRYGGRLGMGGGFYDRSLESLAGRRSEKGIVLAGLGYAFQEQEKLKLEDWDVRLTAIATEKYLVRV